VAEPSIQQLLESAIGHHNAARKAEAERIYRQILAREPNHDQALFYLALIAQDTQHMEASVPLLRRAIEINGGNAAYHHQLGYALHRLRRLEEAAACYRKTIALNPNLAQAHHNLGNTLLQTEESRHLEESLAASRRAIQLDPEIADTYNNLALGLARKGELDEAIAMWRKAVQLKPDFPMFHNNLGNALRTQGNSPQAVAAFRAAIALAPDYAEAWCNLGNALKGVRELDEAIAAYRQAIALRPGMCEAHSNLGNILREQGQLDEAITAGRQAIALGPDFAELHINLGNILKDAGDIDASIAAYRAALGLDPDSVLADDNLVYLMHFHPAYNGAAIAQELARWNRRHAPPMARAAKAHNNDRDPHRRLRIGYVSPDFKDHVVGRNILPLLRRHDRRQFEITCYAQVPSPDAMTEQFQSVADHWHNIVGLFDEQVARQITKDQIDILLDLSLHMAGNRLLVFARKPAPVQVTFAGYPASTGLSAIDYRISDPYLDPPPSTSSGQAGMDESVYSEKTIRLPNTFWCYDPLDNADIAVNDLPAAERGLVTFGCLNNFAKINDDVLALWAAVLKAVDSSRLVMMAGQGSHRQRAVNRLGKEGIDPGRIEFVPFLSRREYLKQYHRIDLGLDSFPYNGHTTSLDSLWMGVPVVTLVGQTSVSRAGWSQLSNLGLGELAAQTHGQFVQIAVELARDLPKLTKLRATLRERMQRSPLMDAEKFARDIEAVYRQIWRSWCETAGG
jgi:predicted O-linked N-acetylglucosamine transferase (SPINDLY family)